MCFYTTPSLEMMPQCLPLSDSSGDLLGCSDGVTEIFQKLIVKGDLVVIAIGSDGTILGSVGLCAVVEHQRCHLCVRGARRRTTMEELL